MSGKKNSNNRFENADGLGLLKKMIHKEQKPSPDESDSSDQIRVFHSGRPRAGSLIKSQGKTPERRPLVNLESMPKPKEKKERQDGKPLAKLRKKRKPRQRLARKSEKRQRLRNSA